MLKSALPSYTIYSISPRPPIHDISQAFLPSPSLTRLRDKRISGVTYTHYVFYTLHCRPYIHQLSIHTLSCQKMTSLFSCYLDMRRYSQLAQQSRYDGTASIVSKNCYLVIKKFTSANELTNRPKFSTVFTLTDHKSTHLIWYTNMFKTIIWALWKSIVLRAIFFTAKRTCPLEILRMFIDLTAMTDAVVYGRSTWNHPYTKH